MVGKKTTEVSIEQELRERLVQIEQTLTLLVQQQTVKDFYTTSEVAKLVGKSSFTVREWCRNRRVAGIKRTCGRGRSCEWIVSNAELTRLKNFGLLPLHSKNREGEGGNHAPR